MIGAIVTRTYIRGIHPSRGFYTQHGQHFKLLFKMKKSIIEIFWRRHNFDKGRSESSSATIALQYIFKWKETSFCKDMNQESFCLYWTVY